MVPQITLSFLLWLGSVAGIPGQTANPPGNNSPKVATETAGNSASHTLQAGTVLYLRLTTPVSTYSSHLNEEVKAEVERAVMDRGEVAIPVGAEVSGRIKKSIPSSSPTDRAKLLLLFDSLTLPGQLPIAMTAHLKEVDNAREALLADGTVVGVLKSELPVTLLNSAIRKIGQSRSTSSQPSQNTDASPAGKADTSITFPEGTEFSLVLDKPLTAIGTFQPMFAQQISDPLKEAVVQLLGQSPKRVANKKGSLGGAVNLAVIGAQQEIQTAFEKAAWTEAAEQDSSSLLKTFEAVIAGKGYDAAPMSTLYLFGRPEDMAFEKMFNTFAMRHHLRLWRAPTSSPDGRPIWLVSADHDNGVDIHPGVISHATDPHVDEERAKVGADLGMTGLVAAEELVMPPNPLQSGQTATGGEWKTDGKVLVIDMKPSSK